MTDTRTKAQRVHDAARITIDWWMARLSGTLAQMPQEIQDLYAALDLPDDPAPQPTLTERDLIQWVIDTVGLSADHERELARRLAALRGGDSERAVLLELREAIQEREDANQRNWRAGITTCKDPAVLHGCSVANNDVIEIIGRLLAAAPDQAAELLCNLCDGTGTVTTTAQQIPGGQPVYGFVGMSPCPRCTPRMTVNAAPDQADAGKVEPAAPPPADADPSDAVKIAEWSVLRAEVRKLIDEMDKIRVAVRPWRDLNHPYGQMSTESAVDFACRILREQPQPTTPPIADADREARIIEALAELEHDQWMAWAQTLTEKEPLLSAERVARWKTCMVPYSELTEEMKEFDRVWARKALALMRTAPASRSVSDLLAEVSRLTTERNEALAECDRLRVALDEREGDMHVRIRAGYDKTVADSWRAEVERLTRERDAAQERVDLDIDEFRRIKAELDDLRIGIAPTNTKVLYDLIAGLCDRAVVAGRQRVPLIEQRDRAERERDEANGSLDALRNAINDHNEVDRSNPIKLPVGRAIGIIRDLRAELAAERGGWAALERLREWARHGDTPRVHHHDAGSTHPVPWVHQGDLVHQVDRLLAERPAKGGAS